MIRKLTCAGNIRNSHPDATGHAFRMMDPPSGAWTEYEVQKDVSFNYRYMAVDGSDILKVPCLKTPLLAVQFRTDGFNHRKHGRNSVQKAGN